MVAEKRHQVIGIDHVRIYVNTFRQSLQILRRDVHHLLVFRQTLL